MAERLLTPGEVLFETGDDGDTVCVVLEGELEVSTRTQSDAELIVGRLGPDDVVGEITAVVGGRRSATVRAVTSTRVLELVGEEFEAWLIEHPERARKLAAEARYRIDRTRVARVVADLIGPNETGLVDEVTDVVEWVSVEAGQALFNQGEEADAAYILVGGQMRVTAQKDGATTIDARIGRGDLIGELGVIERLPRSATATAIRDCTLARIRKDEFERLTAAHPHLMLPVARKVISQVSDRRLAKAHAGNVAIAVTADGLDESFVALLADEVTQHGTTLHLSVERVETLLNRRDIANATGGSASDARLTEFLHEVDVANRWVLVECDQPDSDWSRRALRTADRVCLVASTHPDSDEIRRIEQVCEVVHATGDFDLWLAVVHPNTDATVDGTGALLERTGATRAINIKAGDERSARRLARLLSGNGTGIAFSGGGARSFGQIGALKAMDEIGIVPDAIAGTSMGSVIGALTCIDDDIQRSISRANDAFDGLKLRDYTLPFASVFSAKRMTDRMAKLFGEVDILDTIVPFVCLSTNLTRAELHHHRSGDLVRALRASVSLPGVFPPVAMDGDLLVDGGVLENLPAGPLRRDPGIANVIAVDVAPPGGPRADDDFGMSLSGFEILKRKLRRSSFSHPPIGHTVVAAMLVGSSQARLTALDNDDIDLYISLELPGVKLLDFGELNDSIERGYSGARPALEAWVQRT